MQNGTVTPKSLAVSLQNENTLTILPAISFSLLTQMSRNLLSTPKICTQKCTAGSFTAAKTWKPPSPSVGKWISKLWYSQRNIIQCQKERRDFPGGPVVQNPPSKTQDVGSILGQGTKIPHAAGQLTKPVPQLEKPMCCNKDSVQPRKKKEMSYQARKKQGGNLDASY